MSLKEKLGQLKDSIVSSFDALLAESEETTQPEAGEGSEPKEKMYSADEVNQIIAEITAEYDAKQVAESEGETGFKTFVESKLIKKEEV